MNPDTYARLLIRRRLFPEPPPTQPPLEELRRTEWCPKFEQLMRNRLCLAVFRYGRLHDIDRPRHKNIESTIARLQAYLETGNQEHLVDAANLCMVEFVRPGSHLNPHLAAIDDGMHVEVVT